MSENRSWWSRLREGLTRSRTRLTDGLKDLIVNRPLDQQIDVLAPRNVGRNDERANAKPLGIGRDLFEQMDFARRRRDDHVSTAQC